MAMRAALDCPLCISASRSCPPSGECVDSLLMHGVKSRAKAVVTFNPNAVISAREDFGYLAESFPINLDKLADVKFGRMLRRGRVRCGLSGHIFSS